jgi:F-type H+-transporting ATPase subunit delta
MAEAFTIARPYADAIFKLASKNNNSLSTWSEMLKFIAAVVADEKIKALIGNPQISPQKLREIILAICDTNLNEAGKRLVALLIENERLNVLPQLSELYEQLKAQYESVLEVKIISAFPINAAQLKKLISILEAKFQHKVNAQVSVDNGLIGGVKIEIGDQVIDNSVYGKLEAMAAALKS